MFVYLPTNQPIIQPTKQPTNKPSNHQLQLHGTHQKLLV
jgi:hypothetical protein